MALAVLVFQCVTDKHHPPITPPIQHLVLIPLDRTTILMPVVQSLTDKHHPPTTPPIQHLVLIPLARTTIVVPVVQCLTENHHPPTTRPIIRIVICMDRAVQYHLGKEDQLLIVRASSLLILVTPIQTVLAHRHIAIAPLNRRHSKIRKGMLRTVHLKTNVLFRKNSS